MRFLMRKIRSKEPKFDGIHGHKLLLDYLVSQKNLKLGLLVEIGSTREDIQGQGSTKEFAEFTKRHGIKFISVDMDELQTKKAQDAFKNIGGECLAINAKGEDFIRTYPGDISAIYLDAFDYDHGNHSQERKERYSQILNLSITNANSAQMHLECAKSIVDRGEVEIIAIDDTWRNMGMYLGKGAKAVPFLLSNSYSIVSKSNMALILKRIS